MQNNDHLIVKGKESNQVATLTPSLLLTIYNKHTFYINTLTNDRVLIKISDL